MFAPKFITTVVSMTLALLLSPISSVATEIYTGDTADTWVIDNNTGRTLGSYNAGSVFWTEYATRISTNEARIGVENVSSDTQILGLDLDNQSVMVNEVAGSLPVQTSVLGLPSVSLMGITVPLSDLTDSSKPGIDVTPADGSFSETIKVKLKAVSGRSNSGVMTIKWTINGGTVQSVTLPVDDFETSFYLITNGTYTIDAWSEQVGAADSLHKTASYTIAAVDNTRDTDGDGYPDLWEIANGMDPLSDNRNLDTDGDGWSDFDEILRGSDPSLNKPDGLSCEEMNDLCNPNITDPVICYVPVDKDCDGWSDFDETRRSTRVQESSVLVDAGYSDTPVARRLYEVEYLVSGAIYNDAAQNSERSNMAVMQAYDIDSVQLYDSSGLPDNTTLDNLLGLQDAYLVVKERFRGTFASDSLAQGDYPALRLPASKPIILTTVDVSDPQWAVKTWLNNSPDLDPADVSSIYLAANGTEWTTATQWQDTLITYMDDYLSQDKVGTPGSTINMSPITGLGISLLEGVLSWHSDIPSSALFLLADADSPPSASAVASLRNSLADSASDWNTLHTDLLSLTNPDFELEAFANDVALFYISTGVTDTTLEKAAMLLQGTSVNSVYEYILRLTAVNGLTAIDPADRPGLMDSTVDFDGDGIANAAELAPNFGEHTLPYVADSDGDYLPDQVDPCPNDSFNACLTQIEQGTEDNDGDGIVDAIDNCMNDANPDQLDSNEDGIGDTCRGYANMLMPTSNQTIWLGQTVDFSSVVTELGESKTLTYNWDFGGGASNLTQANPNPVSFYTAGTFNVVLTVTDTSTGDNIGTDTRTITVIGTGPSIDAGGPYQTTEGEEITLTATVNSYGQTGEVSWLPDFGTSMSMVYGNPINYTYSTQGTKNIIVFVTDAFGNNVNAFTTAAVLDSVPIASFTTDVTTGLDPLSVTFTDQSSAYDSIASYAWDFGNGDSSTEASPTYVFQNSGNFNVTLTVTDGDGSMTTSASQPITVNRADVGFNLLPDTDNDGMPDVWENTHGTDYLVDDANLDNDGDTFDNLTEFLNTTDAASVASKPPGPDGNAYVLYGEDLPALIALPDLVPEDNRGNALNQYYKWSNGLVSEFAVKDTFISNTNMVLSLDVPAAGTETCSMASMVSSGVFDGQDYLAKLSNLSYSYTGENFCLSMVADQDLGNAVEVCASTGASNSLVLHLNVYESGALNSVPGSTALSKYISTDFELQKIGNTYKLTSYQNGEGIVQASVVASASVNTNIRPLLRSQTCVDGSNTGIAYISDFKVYTDIDGDGLSDLAEDVNQNGVFDAGETDLNNADTDGDGLIDGDEVNLYGTDPTVPDTDTDNDGVTDGDEVNIYGTDPTNADSDGDTYSDGTEIQMGSDPLDSLSVPTIYDVLRLNTDSIGTQSVGGHSYQPVIAQDGRYTVFSSSANNLVAGDNNSTADVFLKDANTNVTTAMSSDINGVVGNAGSLGQTLSANGQFAAFHTAATNLVVGKTNGISDSYVKNAETGEITLISTDSLGALGNDISIYPSISADGRYVAFHSRATNLVANDTNGSFDVFYRDMQTGTVTRISTDSTGAQISSGGSSSTMSADGRYVVMRISASLVPEDTNGIQDLYRKDILTGEMALVSSDSNGISSNSYSYNSLTSISADGRYVVFFTQASNLNVNDTNGVFDIYRKDMLTGETIRISTDTEGVGANDESRYPSISRNGRYIVFESIATNLVPLDGNARKDIFIKDVYTGRTRRVSIGFDGAEANYDSSIPTISDNGQYIAYYSTANNLIVSDTNGAIDIFRTENPYYSPDTDGDTLRDDIELILGSDINLVDTDGDTLNDGDEVSIYGTDPTLADTDGDGVDDGTEIAAGTNPNDINDFPVSADGDVNGDGVVNAVDILLVTRHVLGINPLTAEQVLHADVAPLIGGVPAPDTEVNTADLLVIQRKALGQISF